MPDLLVVGTLHTLDPSRPRAGAALMRDGRFVKVGTREECEAAATPELKFIELGEGCAVPGIIDAHGHPLLHGRMLAEVRLQGAASEQECVERVARYSQFVPAGQWIRGGGWDQNLWPSRDFPTKTLLSAATPGHPVALARIDVHALWCNDLALQAAGIDRRTPDPPGGRILKAEDGSPTGVLIDTAMDLVRRAFAAPAPREAEETILRSLQALSAVGITAVHDASAGPEVLQAYRRLAERDALPLRIYAMIDGQGAGLDEQIALWRETPRIGRLTVRAVKFFADGALGSRGAAMFEPYEDESGNKGLWLMDPPELEKRIAKAAAAGFQPCVHCIGDQACAVVLQIFASKVPHDLRPRAEHLQALGRGRFDAADARDQRRGVGRSAARPRDRPAAGRVRLAAGAGSRRAARVRQRFSRREFRSARRAQSRRRAQDRERRGVDAGAAADASGSVACIHDRRRLC